VGGGEVCDACVVAALSGGTEEIAKFWYGKLETCPEIAGMGIIWILILIVIMDNIIVCVVCGESASRVSLRV